MKKPDVKLGKKLYDISYLGGPKKMCNEKFVDVRTNICTFISYDLRRDSVNNRQLCDTAYQYATFGCYSATLLQWSYLR